MALILFLELNQLLNTNRVVFFEEVGNGIPQPRVNQQLPGRKRLTIRLKVISRLFVRFQDKVVESSRKQPSAIKRMLRKGGNQVT
jgi:hypothetical protein